MVYGRVRLPKSSGFHASLLRTQQQKQITEQGFVVDVDCSNCTTATCTFHVTTRKVLNTIIPLQFGGCALGWGNRGRAMSLPHSTRACHSVKLCLGTNSSRNISNLINQNGYIMVLAVGMTLVIVIRHIDLSVGFLAGFLGAVAAVALVFWHLPVFVVIPLVLALGILSGMITGFLVARMGIPAGWATGALCRW
jgi:hypothetical protein